MADPVQTVWEMMKKIDFCMLVTKGGHGFMARPMSSIVDADAGLVRFLSNRDAKQIADLNLDTDVLLSYANGSDFVATKGMATVSQDRILIKSAWNAGAQAFWPEGPETADVALITVVPHSAEYWDGDNPVVAVAKMAASLVSGRAPDMGDNRKVAL